MITEENIGEFEYRELNTYLNSYVALTLNGSSGSTFMGIYEIKAVDLIDNTLSIIYEEAIYIFNRSGNCLTDSDFTLAVATADDYDSYIESKKRHKRESLVSRIKDLMYHTTKYDLEQMSTETLNYLESILKNGINQPKFF